MELKRERNVSGKGKIIVSLLENGSILLCGENVALRCNFVACSKKRMCRAQCGCSKEGEKWKRFSVTALSS